MRLSNKAEWTSSGAVQPLSMQPEGKRDVPLKYASDVLLLLMLTDEPMWPTRPHCCVFKEGRKQRTIGPRDREHYDRGGSASGSDVGFFPAAGEIDWTSDARNVALVALMGGGVEVLLLHV